MWAVWPYGGPPYFRLLQQKKERRIGYMATVAENIDDYNDLII